MKALSLFSGIGGIDLACEWAGIETVAFCEREPFCQKVLRKHWPDTPIYDDVCTLTKEKLEADGIGTIDIIHGGYPCQPFSNAGKREGAADDRHLWPEVKRLLESIRPRWFVGENVAGHVTLGLDDVLSELDDIGYTAQSFVIPACAVNAPHRRDRLFIVAHTAFDGCNSWRPESKGQQGELRVVGSSAQAAYVSNSSIPGLSFGGRSSRNQSATQERTRMEPQSERCGENVANPPGVRQSGQGERLHTSHKTEDREGEASKPLNVRIGNQWSVEPDVGRVANGIPHRVDRLKALGNAVVPQQIYPIIAAIKQIDNVLSQYKEDAG